MISMSRMEGFWWDPFEENKKRKSGKQWKYPAALTGETLKTTVLQSWKIIYFWGGISSWMAFTCYLCFSCFCFSFSSFPSLGCWWRVAWRHSRVQLLQANKQHCGHMATGIWNTAKCVTSFDLEPFGIQLQRAVPKHRRAMSGFHAEFFFYTEMSLSPPSARTMMSSWTGINHTSKTQQRGKEGPAWKQCLPAHLTASATYALKFPQHKTKMHMCFYVYLQHSTCNVWISTNTYFVWAMCTIRHCILYLMHAGIIAQTWQQQIRRTTLK